MKDIKIIFFDIDGTLVKMGEKDLSDKTNELLRRLQDKGIRICIATGRSPAALPKLNVKFDAYLLFTGSLCCTADSIIYNNPISPDSVKKVIENAAELGRPVSVATTKRLAANGWEEDLSAYYELAHLKLTVADDFEEACQEGVYQIMLGGREWEHDAITKGVDGVKAVSSWHRAVDVIPADGGKGVGIQKILEYFGLTADQAMAFGDSSNDLDMLQTVGTGVAMGNATDRLKAVADDICLSAEEEGLYYYCLEKGLI